MKRQIPNIITCFNVFFGCVACVFALQGQFEVAGIAVLFAALCDFCDGMVARILDVVSSIGKELDSLADIVSFGVAPSMILFSFLQKILPSDLQWLSFFAFLIAMFSAVRLAKFNVDIRQTTSFIGLPTPANSLFWIFLVIEMNKQGITFSLPFIVILLFCEFVFCYLLIAEIPMFSLKFKSFSWTENKIRFLFLLISLLLILFLQLSAFPVIIGLYILMSIFQKEIAK